MSLRDLKPPLLFLLFSFLVNVSRSGSMVVLGDPIFANVSRFGVVGTEGVSKLLAQFVWYIQHFGHQWLFCIGFCNTRWGGCKLEGGRVYINKRQR